jgi:hypothetical protein
MSQEMTRRESRERDRMFLKLFFKSSPDEGTEEEVAYFRDHPDEIDEWTKPVNVHKVFLWAGALVGIACVGLSKVLKFQPVIASMPEGFREFAIDIVFESGVALIGAAVTAYILGILLNQQQETATRWRGEVRRAIGKNQDPD